MESTKENQLFNRIVKKAWEDENFKNQLIQDPTSAIENLTGEKLNLPEGKEVIVNDQTNNSYIYINIPTKPNVEDLQLTEEQLEAVAGGVSIGEIFDMVGEALKATITTIPKIL
jgi:hypothetical protein